MKYTFALVGNQNSGKTTLFNQLTGSNQHVGNFPGVTVEKKEGVMRKEKNAVVVDLPGIYSLSPYTAEEVVTRDFALGVDGEKPDGIINIVDATNIERNLYLTLQLAELKIPMVLALNMMDEVAQNGNFIDIKKLSEMLGIPVVPISASHNDGVDELVSVCLETIKNKKAPDKVDFCRDGDLHKAIHSVAHIVEDHAKEKGIPVRFAATKLIEGDEPMQKLLDLHENEISLIKIITEDLEKSLLTYRDAALADMRYDYIEDVCKNAVFKKSVVTKQQKRTEKIDNILTHKIFSIPIFIGVMFLVFYLTFGIFGATLSGWFEEGIDAVIGVIDNALGVWGVSEWLHSLIIDGVCAGVGSVLSFLPTIVILFFFLSILEDSGYMARVAFVMDKLLRKIGLSGKSIVPMLIGFGCSVPAIMSTRTLSSERDRKMTILLVPFMSCSAKMPIYAVFTKAFFPQSGALVMVVLYFVGILMGIVSALIFKETLFKGKSIPFVMELPSYRMPSAKSVMLHMWDKAKDFIVRAFTVIFYATIIIWLLQSFDIRFNFITDSSHSILAYISKFIAPVFYPLGFGDWKAVSALITGLSAKEAVVSSLAVLTGAGEAGLNNALYAMFGTNILSVWSFLIFTLLYMPCVAAMAAVRRELGSGKAAVLAMAYQTVFAYVCAFLIYQIGGLFI